VARLPIDVRALETENTMAQSAAVLQLEVEGKKVILPDAEGVFDAIARIGYEFEHAIADLVDNSIDAGATEVLIRFFHNRKAVYSVAVIDNGCGMNGPRIDKAMAFGARTGRNEIDLGKYGMGLKSASFSQCDTLTVVSRNRGDVVGRRWTAENVRKNWICEAIAPASADRHLTGQSDQVDTARQGTLVQWNRLDAMSHSVERPSKTIETRFGQLSIHLGLVFHRFLEADAVRIRLDSADPEGGTRGFPQTIKPLNPFPKHQAVAGYPRVFHFEHEGAGELEFEAHIWRRNATEAGFRLGGGRLAKRQGFYIYRNRRLIQPGGWNGLRNDAEVHTSLARVCLDIQPQLDSLFKPTVQKSSVTITPSFLKSLKEATCGKKSFNDFLRDAEKAYRDTTGARMTHGLVPVEGMTRQLIKRFERVLGEPADEEDMVSFEWSKLRDDEFFSIDPESNTVMLNSSYRSNVLHGLKGSSGDAPVVKTLLMLLCKDDMRRVNRVKKYEEQLRISNQLLVEAAKSQ
jgi:hypothetical protein